MSKTLTYHQFCRKFNLIHPTLETVKALQAEHNIKIQDLHNKIESAKLDGRL